MKPLLVIQHLEREHTGVFSEVLDRQPAPRRLVRTYAGEAVPADPGGFSGLLVMGGLMNVDQAGLYPHLTQEMRLIRLAHREGVPVLGICLGAQLAAAALGARVYQGEVKEIGWYEVELSPGAGTDPLFGGFPGRFRVLQWHGQTFDLPAGATRLASSRSYLNQAFRCGSCWGIQFHLEADGPLVRCWLEAGSDELAASPGVDRDEILAGIASYEQNCLRLGRELFERFIGVVKDAADGWAHGAVSE
ncbi:MAG: type 1 glutamine amidotransferase [Candidatus Glassbacteria bacterium]|nr:type 1 glutamine amidotransferase [Candidatus Glassbacteria bacterium]